MNDFNINDIDVSIIKLTSGDELIAIISDTHSIMSTHEEYDENIDYGFWIEFPLKIYSVVDYEHGIHSSSFFTQWMPLSKDRLIPINYDTVISHAPANDRIKRRYFEMIEMFSKMDEDTIDVEDNIDENDFTNEEYDEYSVKNKEKPNDKKPVLH